MKRTIAIKLAIKHRFSCPKELSKNKMNYFTAPNQPKIDDQKWVSIHSDTTPFLIVDFRRFRVGQMVHFILRQFLSVVASSTAT